ncbi:Dynein alpha chain, flagellar outer arm, partial [Lamellibrachia satsuma]
FGCCQECMWLNCLLSHIRQNIHDLQQSLLSGPDAFPWQLKKTADSLVLGQVPITWVHPNCQPTTHSLSSWRADLRQRYEQMSGWLKQRMVPIFHVAHNPPVTYGQLKRVWLGGLVNPEALLTAIMHEAAMVCGCLVDQMAVSCDLLAPAESYDEGSGIVFYGAYLQGAQWDVNGQCLSPSRQDVNPLPDIYVKLVHVVEKGTDGASKFLCPVFMNMARQVCTFHLPMTAGDTAADMWTLAGTAIILDRG